MKIDELYYFKKNNNNNENKNKKNVKKVTMEDLESLLDSVLLLFIFYSMKMILKQLLLMHLN